MNGHNYEKERAFVLKCLEESDPPPTLHEILKRLANAHLRTPHWLVKDMRARKVLELASKPLVQNLGDQLKVVVPTVVRPIVRPNPVPYEQRPIAERPLDRVLEEATGTVDGSRFTDEERARGRATVLDHARERQKWAESHMLEHPALNASQLTAAVRLQFGVGIRDELAREIVKTVQDLQQKKPAERLQGFTTKEPTPLEKNLAAVKPIVVSIPKDAVLPEQKPGALVFVDEPPPARAHDTVENQHAKEVFAELLNNPGKWALVKLPAPNGKHAENVKALNRLCQGFKRLGAEAMVRGTAVYARATLK